MGRGKPTRYLQQPKQGGLDFHSPTAHSTAGATHLVSSSHTTVSKPVPVAPSASMRAEPCVLVYSVLRSNSHRTYDAWESTRRVVRLPPKSENVQSACMHACVRHDGLAAAVTVGLCAVASCHIALLDEQKKQAVSMGCAP